MLKKAISRVASFIYEVSYLSERFLLPLELLCDGRNIVGRALIKLVGNNEFAQIFIEGPYHSRALH